jgi:murein DD-endopeptidase MepM/ murein hydrolase activator NlpD
MIRLIPLLLGLLLSGCASYSELGAQNNGSKNDLGWQESPFASSKLDLNLCNTKVSNPPNSIAGRVLRESSRACVAGRQLLIAPAVGACVTSGYGRRSGKQHHGIDYQARPADSIMAAAAGTVVQKSYRAKDLGNWIVIDHGKGVFSAYGHLSSFQRGISVGKKVRQGQTLGVMGATGKAARGVHLHYEVRVGRLSPSKSFFSLQSLDLFALPADCG